MKKAIKKISWTRLRRIPSIVDLVEDNSRSRYLFPLLAMTLYALVMFAIVNIVTEEDNTPSEVKLLLPLASNYDTNNYLSYKFPAPRIQVNSATGNLKNTTVLLLVSDIITAKDASAPDCDYLTRAEIGGTLEFIRLDQVCAIEGINLNADTDEDGIATMNDIEFKRAPQATYTLNFAVRNNGSLFKSADYSFFLQSIVSSMNVTNSPPFSYDLTVDPLSDENVFTTQPEVIAKDISGNPVVGKKIVAFSWPEPTFLSYGSNYNIEAQKFAWLEGAVSEPSDENGVAKFTNLRIVGSTSKYVNIFFSADAKQVASWTPGLSMGQTLYKIKAFQPAILLNTAVASVTIVTQPSSTVVEGKPFAVPPKVQVLDVNGSPLKSRLVIAMISYAYGGRLPFGYLFKKNPITHKDLVKPIPGVYNSEYTNPVHENELLIPLLTDSNGEVEFTDMYFTVYGSAGTFRLVFKCDGISSPETNDITVTTQVAQINILTQPILSADLSNIDFNKDFFVFIEAVDSLGLGVAGKIPTVSFAAYDSMTSTTQLINAASMVYFDANLDDTRIDFSPTDENGLFKAFFDLLSLAPQGTNSDRIYIEITLTIDGVSVTTRRTEIIQEGGGGACGSISLSYPPTTHTNGETLEIKVDLFDDAGYNLADVDELELMFKYVSTGTQLSSETFSPFSPLIISAPALSGGSYTFSIPNFQAPTGMLYYRIRAVSLDDSAGTTTTSSTSTTDEAALIEANANAIDIDEGDGSGDTARDQYVENLAASGVAKVCYSKFYTITVTEPWSLQKIETTWTYDSADYRQLMMDSSTKTWSYSLVLTFYDAYGLPIPNQNFLMGYKFLQKPWYLANATTSSFFKWSLISNQSTTDTVGQVSVTLTFTQGNPGFYALNIWCGSVYTDPILLQAKLPPDWNIQILTNPTTSYTASQGTPTGVYLSSVTVRVLDMNLDGVENVMVLAVAESNVTSTTKNVMIDITDTPDEVDQTLTLSPNRFRAIRTNGIGIAEFTQLSVIDVMGTHFKFLIGQKGDLYTSAPTATPICFRNYGVVQFASFSYSRVISQDKQLVNPISIQLIKPNWDIKAPIIVVVAPYWVNGKYITNPFLYSLRAMKFHVCSYVDGKILNRMSGYCSPTISNLNSRSTTSTTVSIQFTSLKWVASSSQTQFLASCSTPLSLLNPTISNATARYNVQTSLITVSNIPHSIIIMSQPPPTVFVGDSFIVTTLNRISSGSPVGRIQGTAAVTLSSSTTASLSSSAMKRVLTKFSTGITSSSEIESLNAGTGKGATLDPATTTSGADRKGITHYNLRFISGLPGEYTLTFQAKIDSKTGVMVKSAAFTVLNRVLSANLTNADQITFKSEVDTENGDYTTLAVQPEIQLSYLNNVNADDLRKLFKVSVYTYIDNEALRTYNVTPAELEYKNFQTRYQEAFDNLTAEANDPTSELTKMITSILNGGTSSAENKELGYSYDFAYPQINNGLVQFQDLKVQFLKPGDYMLVFSVDGIETSPTQKITITKPTDAGTLAANVLQYIIIVLTFFFVLLSTDPVHRRFWYILGTVFVIASIIVVSFTSSGLTWKIVLYILMTGIIVAMLEIIYKTRQVDKGKENTMFYSIRDQTFYKQTKMALWNVIPRHLPKARKISLRLMAGPENPENGDQINIEEPKISNRNKHDSDDISLTDIVEPTTNIVPFETNFKNLIVVATKTADNTINLGRRAANEGSPQIRTPFRGDPDNLFAETEREKQIFDPDNDMMLKGQSDHPVYEDKPVLEIKFNNDDDRPPRKDDQIPVEPGSADILHTETNAIASEDEPKKKPGVTKRLLMPYRKLKDEQLSDGFFYPQRVLAAVFLTIVTIGFFIYLTFEVIIIAADSISGMKTKIMLATFQFMNAALNSLLILNPTASFSEDTLSVSVAVAQFVGYQFELLADAIIRGFIMSAIVSIIIYILALRTFTNDFRTRILKLRRGDPEEKEEIEKIPLKQSSQFGGFYIGNSTFAYLVDIIAFGILLSILNYPLFWRALWELKPVIITVIVAAIISWLTELPLKTFIDKAVEYRRLWAIAEFILIYMSVAAEVTEALSRFIKLFAVSLYGISRIERPMYPGWILRIVKLDNGYNSYLAMIKMYHLHNHPMHITTARLLMEGIQANKNDGTKDELTLKAERKKKLLANRMWLAIFLLKTMSNPQLFKMMTNSRKKKTHMLLKDVCA